MADYSSGSAVFISLIVGIILSLFLDGIFTLAFTGFLATFLTHDEEKSAAVGVIASLILGVFIFTYGFVLTPELPYRILNYVNFNFSDFIAGLILVCLISISLGAVGGFVANKVSNFKEIP